MSYERNWHNDAGGEDVMSTYLDDDTSMGVIQFNGGKRPIMVHLNVASLGELIDSLLEIRAGLLEE